MSAHDFDFLFGAWTVEHERATDPFDPESSDVVRFTTAVNAGPVLGGSGNVDETGGELPDGNTFRGMTLRLFDPATDEWSIWWASTDRPGVLDPPVRGRFENGVGTFLGSDERDGVPFLARFVWRDVDSPHPIWEQDFSLDDGATWLPINWRMIHSRLFERDEPM